MALPSVVDFIQSVDNLKNKNKNKVSLLPEQKILPVL